MEPSVTPVLVDVLGDGGIVTGSFGVRQTIHYSSLLAVAVAGSNNEESFNFADFSAPVVAVLNRTLGVIEAGVFPAKAPTPVLTIHDSVLAQRCSDLLHASGQFDRVVREATLVLEDRLKSSVPLETLEKLIPDSGKRGGENLVNKLLSPSEPVLFVSADQREQAAFQKIMLGVFSYLRNPFHHSIDETTEWSWAWSIVGLVDHLLFELGSCEKHQDEKDQVSN